MENFVLENWHITIIGWIAWNVGLFSFTKDEFDDTGKAFPIIEYIGQHWDNWLFSLWMIPVILILGFYGLGMDAFSIVDIDHPKLKEALFYLSAGFLAEAGKYKYKKWRKQKSNEE